MFGYKTDEGVWGSRLTGTYNGAKKASDIDQVSSEPPALDASLVLDLVAWHAVGESGLLRAGLNNLTNEKFFLWSSSRRGGGHSSSSTEDRNRQPGINGFIGFAFDF